jgi:glycosyltransferase involved in cell wall biosynthesis
VLHEEFLNHVLPAIPNAKLNIVREQNVPSHSSVTSHGYVSVETLVGLYQSSWVFCLPSSYEGFGVPYVEALSTGTPIVYTPNEGGDYVLDQGRYAVRTNIETLGCDLSSLLQDDEKRKKLATDGIQRSTLFDLQRIASTYVKLVDQHVG